MAAHTEQAGERSMGRFAQVEGGVHALAIKRQLQRIGSRAVQAGCGERHLHVHQAAQVGARMQIHGGRGAGERGTEM